MGRPEGLAVTDGLPASLSNTKRFMNATRAAGAMREKDSLLRPVRKREKSFWLCEQAAVRTSRRAADGPFGELGCTAGAELDSCAEAQRTSNRNKAVRTINCAVPMVFRNFTSVLCGAQDGGQVLRKGGARHHFVTSGCLRLRCQVALHVR